MGVQKESEWSGSFKITEIGLELLCDTGKKARELGQFLDRMNAFFQLAMPESFLAENPRILPNIKITEHIIYGEREVLKIPQGS